MDHSPPQVTGLRLVLRDGSEFPVECVFVGYNDEGIAVWRAVVPVAMDSQVTHLKANRWPPKVGVEFEVSE